MTRLSPNWHSDHGASSPEDAAARFIARVGVPSDNVRTESIDALDAPGRVLAEALTADRDAPPCDVSAMDGFAIAAADAHAPSLPVAGEARIGRHPAPHTPGTATRIVTGAPIPHGADLVIKREDVEDHDDSIRMLQPGRAKPGDHIRRRGENLPSGAVAIEPGHTISPTVAGALASFGRTSVAVFRRLRVGVILTGDEVVDAAATPSPYEVRDSHAPALRAMLGAVPWIDLAPPMHVRDDEAALETALRDTLAQADALILTAGVSVGPRDLVPDALSRLGAETLFRGVRQRPGRPTMGAITPDARPIFALPGNPLSVFVAARAIVAPVLAHMAGLKPNALAPTLVELSNPDHRAAPHHWHRLVTLEAPAQARLVPMQSSGDIPAAARASGFITIPPETNTNAPTHHPYHPWNL